MRVMGRPEGPWLRRLRLGVTMLILGAAAVLCLLLVLGLFMDARP